MAAPTIYMATPCHRGSSEALAEIYTFADRTLTDLGLSGQVGIVSNCPWLDCARTDLVTEFLSGSCSHLLFRDDDILFDTSLVLRMLMRKSPVVIAAYRERLPPYRWAIHIDDSGKVQYAGLGACLLSRELLQRMTEEYRDTLEYEEISGALKVNLFAHRFMLIEGKKRLLKEDHAFFSRIHDLGYKIDQVTGVVTHGGIRSDLEESNS
jgi:hypothetical protein